MSPALCQSIGDLRTLEWAEGVQKNHNSQQQSTGAREMAPKGLFILVNEN